LKFITLYSDKSVRPYKKIGEEAESDHGTDNECVISNEQGIVLTRKKRGSVKKNKLITSNLAKTILQKEGVVRLSNNLNIDSSKKFSILSINYFFQLSIIFYIDSAAYAEATCKFSSCSTATFDICDKCKRDYCNTHLDNHLCNTIPEVSKPSLQLEPIIHSTPVAQVTGTQKSSSSRSKKIVNTTVASVKEKRRINKIDMYVGSDDENISEEDTSENEEDENFVSKSKSTVFNGAQTRGSSRPTRSAATKANRNLTTRKNGTDYHLQPELLYEQQVHR